MISILRRAMFGLVTLVCLANISSVQATYIPSAENIKGRETFRDNKPSFFIHWGIYSMLADGEWALQVKGLKVQDYCKLASGFYPAKFNADEWVAAVKGSGAKYICITSRHYDGFSMIDTKYSDYSIVKASPFKLDILKELAQACEKQGIKLHVYYSHFYLDWDREDYPLGSSGKNNGRATDKEDWNSYYKFMNNQLTELLANYGRSGALWFDGKWEQKKDFNWQLSEQYPLIHSIQPGCLIGNNHHEDFQMFERDLPGQNTKGISGQPIGQLLLETCETLNKTWGYNIRDRDFRPLNEIIHLHAKSAGSNDNLLTTVRPQPNGERPARNFEQFKPIGEWMKIFGNTIYDTSVGMIAPAGCGVTTQKGNTLFVHVVNKTDNTLFLHQKNIKVKNATVFQTGKGLTFTLIKEGVVVTLDKVPYEIDYVVQLDF